MSVCDSEEAERKMSDETAKDSMAWWRTVLGEFPTGVVLVTTTDPAGEPAAMIAGSFVAVSQDPPMVGFLPVEDSRTFHALNDTGTFSVSILGAEHEHLSRAFGSSAARQFDRAEWDRSADGNLRLRGALAWFDCSVAAAHEAGDHVMVLADVREFGVGDGGGGLPLLFLRGGYGTFALPSEQFDVTDLSRKLRIVSRLRAIISGLAEKHGVGVLLGALAGESVVVLAEAKGWSVGEDSHEHEEFGFNFPYAAPMSPALAAWAPAERTKLWLEGARHLIGAVDRTGYGELLEQVRNRGYAISSGPTMVERFDSVIASKSHDRAEIVSLWRDLQRDHEDQLDSGAISSIQIPIFDEYGHAVMEIVVTGLDLVGELELELIVASAFEAARDSTELIGGRLSPDWAAVAQH